MAIFSSVNFSGILQKVITMSIWVVVIIIAIVVVWFWYNRSKYKFTCIIYLKRADEQSEIKIDTGGFFKIKGGDFIFKLLKSKHTIPPPANKFICRRARGKPIVHFRCFGSDLYEPFVPSFNTEAEDRFLTELDYDSTLSWSISTKDRIKAALDLGTIWEKYGGILTLMFSIIAVIAVIFLVLKFAQATVTDLTGAIRDATNPFMKWAEAQASGGAPPAP